MAFVVEAFCGDAGFLSCPFTDSWSSVATVPVMLGINRLALPPFRLSESISDGFLTSNE